MPIKLSRMEAALSARACRGMLRDVLKYANVGSLTPDLQKAHASEIASLERLIALFDVHVVRKQAP